MAASEEKESVPAWPNIYSSAVGLMLGTYSLIMTIMGEEQSTVEYANSYITILSGVINGW